MKLLSIIRSRFTIASVLCLINLITPLFFANVASTEVETMPCGHTKADVVLMLDRTGSISAENRVLIREAAQNLVSILLIANPDNRIALGRFGSIDCVPGMASTGIDTASASLGEIFYDFSNDSMALENALATALEYSSCGATNLEDPLRDAEEILASAINQHKILVLLSDGNPNQPQSIQTPKDLALLAAEDLKNTETRIFTVAFDASNATDKTLRDFLAQIASHNSLDNTEGEVDDGEKQTENHDGDDFFIAPSGEDLAPVFQNIGEIILCEVESELEEGPTVELTDENLEVLPVDSLPITPVEISSLEDSNWNVQGSGSMGCSLRKN